MTSIYFLRLSKVWSILRHGSVRRVFKKMLVDAFIYFFWHFVVVFYHKICVFIIFISFFDEISNFHNRILTNQKRELAVSNCQLNRTLKTALSEVHEMQRIDLR